MCDTGQFSNAGGMNRRQFTAISAAAMLAACSPMDADVAQAADGGLVESAVTFDAPGGTMDGIFIHPASGKHPAVILWPDIAGLRPAKLEMGRRLAAAGYAVLVANPYYRSVAGQQFEKFADLLEVGFGTVAPWRARNTPEAVMESAAAIVAWLDAQPAVDTASGIGVQGYCMTGEWTIYAASAVPERVKAAASFHAGPLAGDSPTAPIALLGTLADDASVHVATAQDDHAKRLDEAPALLARGEEIAAALSVEVYAADHGWTVLDSPKYNEPEAERAWAALLALYEGTL